MHKGYEDLLQAGKSGQGHGGIQTVRLASQKGAGSRAFEKGNELPGYDSGGTGGG